MKKLALGALLTGLVACGGGGNGEDDIVFPDSNTVDAVSVCSPLTQMGCAAGEKCAWVEVQESPPLGQIACVPDGTVAAGGACTVGAAGPAGYSNCAAGTECVAGTCKTICDHQGGAPMCDSNHSCSRYEALFESGDVTVAGVCDPKCDPLTQNLLAGTNTAACGSPDPAAPNAGCFTFDFVDFTCAPVGPSTLTLTDGMPARTSPSGQAYVNGCAPGFLPFFAERTGSNVAICSGMCAPLKTDNTLRANVVGSSTALAKLPTAAEPVAGDGRCITNKKGERALQTTPVVDGENCRYLWLFNFENGQLVDSTYNDTLGVCWNVLDREYTYDHDNNASTEPRLIPSCANLAPKDATVANCTCDANGSCTGTGCPDGKAHEWGCYSTTDSMAFQNGRAKVPARAKAVASDYRVGTASEGKLFRHVIR